MIFAVIDTNVFVSALLTKHRDSATAKVVEAVLDGRITDVLHIYFISTVTLKKL